jgi:hypothetical protein
LGRKRVLDRYYKLILGLAKATPKKIVMIQRGKYSTGDGILIMIVTCSIGIMRMGNNEILNIPYNL